MSTTQAGVVFAAVLFGWSEGALACDKPGDADCAVEGGAAKADPTQCSRRPELVDRDACAWTTSMMAQRVVTEGQPYTYVGHLASNERVLASKVATPYTIGPDATIFVIANEVLDKLIGDGEAAAGRVQVTGRLLEVEGVTYFVATTFVATRS